MKKRYILILVVILLLGSFIMFNAYSNNTRDNKSEINNSQTVNSDTYKKDFEIDVTITSNNRTIHHTRYIPQNINKLNKVNMYITLPGWEGLYFQGKGANLVEDFYWRAKQLNPNMIILAPQLDDWGNQSAEDTILLTEYYKEKYNVDKIYINGLSGGGETLSLVLNKKPELYTRALMVSSQWNGEVTALVNAKTPVYFFIGENDSYYGSQNFKETYNKIYKAYQNKKLSEKEIEQLVILDVRNHKYFTDHDINDEHMGANLASHEDSIMKWLLEL